MVRRRLLRTLVAAALVGGVAVPIGVAATSRTPASAATKLTPAMRQLVEKGYRGFDIAAVVPGHVAGHVYSLVRLTAFDAPTVDAVRRAGAHVRAEFPEIDVVAVDSTPDVVARVAALPQVTRVDVDKVLHVESLDVRYVSASAAAAYADQTKRGTHDVGADALWSIGVTGQGVTVGVADSGIDVTHPDLDGGKVTAFTDCQTKLPAPLVGMDDVGTCVPHPGYDDNGHGTHVSGIAAGSGEGLLRGGRRALPGMAPGASIAGAKVCNGAGSCLNSSVMAGFRWLSEDPPNGAGADVVNMSLGGGRSYGFPLGAQQVTNDDDEARLVNALADRYNVVFTISAGNSGPVLQSVGSPAVASQAIAVGASIADFDLNHPVEQTEHGEFGNIRPDAPAHGATGIASFSSRGPSGDRLVKPELTAPGSYVVAAQSKEGGEVGAADFAHQNHYSSNPDYAVLSGTSMSSPAAAGVAALLIDGFRQATRGTSPRYFQVKAAMANTAGTHAFEGPIAGLLGTIKSRTGLPGQTPAELYPDRNAWWVGVTGEGAGRVNAAAAYVALTRGVITYTPREGALDDIHEQQPNWALDDVAPGETRRQAFMFHPGPLLDGVAHATFSVDSGLEAAGIHPIPARWFALPGRVDVTSHAGDTRYWLTVKVPGNAAPGQYAATVVATVDLGRGVVQHVRLPVQLFVPLPATGRSAVEGPIWASQTTDWSLVGSANPEGDVYTDWITFPLRLAKGTNRVDLSVYDKAGADHMDVFVFDGKGKEIDSTVSHEDVHVLPGGAVWAPTTKDGPATVSLLDGDDLNTVTLPATVWVTVADSGRSGGAGFRTFHLDTTVLGGADAKMTTAPGGTTPADRIHSGSHAWWGGSAARSTSSLARQVTIPAGAKQLSFWTWYELEDGCDWAYALVSTDGGRTWTSLATSSPEDGSGTTGQDVSLLGSAKVFPNGFTGSSGVSPTFTCQNPVPPVLSHQVADVSAYAGKKVLLGFLTTSDDNTNLAGFYVDDVSITTGAGTVVWSDPVDAPDGWIPGGTPGFTFVTKA